MCTLTKIMSAFGRLARRRFTTAPCLALAVVCTLIFLVSHSHAATGAWAGWNDTDVYIPDFGDHVSTYIDVTKAPPDARITEASVAFSIVHDQLDDLIAWITYEDPDGVWHDKTVRLFSWYAGTMIGNRQVVGHIYDWNYASPNHRWYLCVRDAVGGGGVGGYIARFEIWIDYEYDIVSAPTSITGNTSPFVGQTCQYTASGAFCDCGADPEYMFDWGDGNVSNWGPATLSHAWQDHGTYNIGVKACCPVHDVESIWCPLTVTVSHPTLSVTEDPPGSGTVIRFPAPPYSYNDAVHLAAVPSGASWWFSHWSGDVGGSDSTTLVHMTGNKSVTANFGPAPSVTFSGGVSINGLPAVSGDGVWVCDPDDVLCGAWAVTSAGSYGPLSVLADNPSTLEDEGAEPGDPLEFRVYDDSSGHIYSGYELFVNPMSGSYPPEWTAGGDSWEVYLAARDATDDFPATKVTIFTDNNPFKSRDQVAIQGLDLPSSLIATGFDPQTDDVCVFMDGAVFDIMPGHFVKVGAGNVYRYTSGPKSQPIVRMVLNLTRGTWSFEAKKGMFFDWITIPDGIDLGMVVGQNYYADNLQMDEKTRWTFNSRKNTFVTYPGSLDPSIDIAKGLKNSALNGKDTFSISKAAFTPKPYVTALTDAVYLGIDGMDFHIPATSFVKKGNRALYVYQSSGGPPRIRMVVDLNEGRWTFSMTKGSCAGIDNTDGIDVLLSISGNDGSVTIYPDQKTTLVYPKK